MFNFKLVLIVIVGVLGCFASAFVLALMKDISNILVTLVMIWVICITKMKALYNSWINGD